MGGGARARAGGAGRPAAAAARAAARRRRAWWAQRCARGLCWGGRRAGSAPGAAARGARHTAIRDAQPTLLQHGREALAAGGQHQLVATHLPAVRPDDREVGEGALVEVARHTAVDGAHLVLDDHILRGGRGGGLSGRAGLGLCFPRAGRAGRPAVRPAASRSRAAAAARRRDAPHKAGRGARGGRQPASRCAGPPAAAPCPISASAGPLDPAAGHRRPGSERRRQRAHGAALASCAPGPLTLPRAPSAATDDGSSAIWPPASCACSRAGPRGRAASPPPPGWSRRTAAPGERLGRGRGCSAITRCRPCVHCGLNRPQATAPNEGRRVVPCTSAVKYTPC
jgi:hypothetical protein